MVYRKTFVLILFFIINHTLLPQEIIIEQLQGAEKKLFDAKKDLELVRNLDTQDVLVVQLTNITNTLYEKRMLLSDMIFVSPNIINKAITHKIINDNITKHNNTPSIHHEEIQKTVLHKAYNDYQRLFTDSTIHTPTCAQAMLHKSINDQTAFQSHPNFPTVSEFTLQHAIEHKTFDDLDGTIINTQQPMTILKEYYERSIQDKAEDDEEFIASDEKTKLRLQAIDDKILVNTNNKDTLIQDAILDKIKQDAIPVDTRFIDAIITKTDHNMLLIQDDQPQQIWLKSIQQKIEQTSLDTMQEKEEQKAAAEKQAQEKEKIQASTTREQAINDKFIIDEQYREENSLSTRYINSIKDKADTDRTFIENNSKVQFIQKAIDDKLQIDQAQLENLSVLKIKTAIIDKMTNDTTKISIDPKLQKWMQAINDKT